MGKLELDTVGIAPGFTVNDLTKSIHFYVEGLGFTISQRHEAEGVLRFVMLKAGNSELALGQDDFAKGKDRVKGVAVRLYVTTKQDLQQLAAQAKAAGIVLDHEVMAMPWGQLAFAVTDPDGFKLTIANER